MNELTKFNKENLSSISSLIATIHNLSSNFLENKLSNIGLDGMSSSHGFILFNLSLTDKLTMKEISEKIDKNKSTTTVLINKLESFGYVIREKNESDNRICYIRLSKKGLEYTNKMQSISTELTELFYKNFSDNDKQIVFKLLKQIQKNLTISDKN